VVFPLGNEFDGRGGKEGCIVLYAHHGTFSSDTCGSVGEEERSVGSKLDDGGSKPAAVLGVFPAR